MGRLEQFVCHQDAAGYTQDDDSVAQFAGNPRINCLSDNEAWTYASDSDSGQPVANPNQYVLYVGMERDGGEVVAMHEDLRLLREGPRRGVRATSLRLRRHVAAMLRGLSLRPRRACPRSRGLS